jgi:hypothetical protein
MPWDQVGRRRYYYRSEWVSGQSVRRYVGTGAVAEMAASADELRRLRRAIEARLLRDETARREEAEAPLHKLCAVTDVLTRAALVAAGYHRHDRGTWRLCRDRHSPKTGGSPVRG